MFCVSHPPPAPSLPQGFIIDKIKSCRSSGASRRGTESTAAATANQKLSLRRHPRPNLGRFCRYRSSLRSPATGSASCTYLKPRRRRGKELSEAKRGARRGLGFVRQPRSLPKAEEGGTATGHIS